MSDEKEKEQKMEENEEKSLHSGIKGSACISLCCTKQSQAEHLSFFSIYLEKNRMGEEERGRGMEKCWEERERGLWWFKIQSSPTRVRAKQNRKPKKDKDLKVSLFPSAPHHRVNLQQLSTK